MTFERLESFAEFWPYYVREHRRPATRAWHVAGTSLAMAIAVTAAVLRQWIWLAAVPLCGYGCAWISHFCIERNRPATFKYPWWSLLGDLKLWRLTITGRMGAEVRRIPQEP